MNQPWVYIYPLPFEPPSNLLPHPTSLIQSPCLSFLSHTANSGWLSISHMVMEVSMLPFPCISPSPALPPCSQAYSLCLFLHCCPVSKFFSTIFLDSVYKHQNRCPSPDEWTKKLWHIYTMEYYSAIKRNAFDSVLMRQMNLEPMIHSEVSQKEKYHILVHIYGIQGNGTEEFYRAAMEKLTQRIDLWTWGEGRRG